MTNASPRRRSPIQPPTKGGRLVGDWRLWIGAILLTGALILAAILRGLPFADSGGHVGSAAGAGNVGRNPSGAPQTGEAPVEPHLPDVTDSWPRGPEPAARDERQSAKISRAMHAQPGGGVAVDEAPPGSIAADLGLQQGDVILSVNTVKVDSPEDFGRIYREQGRPRQIEALRDGRIIHRHP